MLTRINGLHHQVSVNTTWTDSAGVSSESRSNNSVTLMMPSDIGDEFSNSTQPASIESIEASSSSVSVMYMNMMHSSHLNKHVIKKYKLIHDVENIWLRKFYRFRFC